MSNKYRYTGEQLAQNSFELCYTNVCSEFSRYVKVVYLRTRLFVRRRECMFLRFVWFDMFLCFCVLCCLCNFLEYLRRFPPPGLNVGNTLRAGLNVGDL